MEIIRRRLCRNAQHLHTFFCFHRNGQTQIISRCPPCHQCHIVRQQKAYESPAKENCCHNPKRQAFPSAFSCISFHKKASRIVFLKQACFFFMIASEKHPIQGKKIQTSRKQIFRHMEIFAKKEKALSKFFLRKHWVFWIS